MEDAKVKELIKQYEKYYGSIKGYNEVIQRAIINALKAGYQIGQADFAEMVYVKQNKNKL